MTLAADAPLPADPLAPGMPPAVFRRFVRVGQGLKLAGFLAALALAVTRHATALDAALFAGMAIATMLGVTAGMHRLYAHQSYKAHPLLARTLSLLATMAGQGTVLIWVAVHRRHHQFADRAGDPHSPRVGQDGPATSRAGGLWHAHVGWILDFYPQELGRLVPDLLRDDWLVWLHRRNVLVIWLGVLGPAIADALLAHTWQGFWTGFVWGGWARMFVVEQVTCLVNSGGHAWGRRPYDTRDDSTNVGWLFGLLSLGEGWHNNHHAFPASARHGLAWWQLDPTYMAIRLWQLVGLASQPVLPTPEQLRAKRASGAPAAEAPDVGRAG